MSTFKGFSQVELTRPTRSTFDLSHDKKISTRIGKLTPIFITETLPNDTFNGSSEVLIKFQPMPAPIYHRLHCYVHYFFIPMRLLWNPDDWEKFITGGRLGPGIDVPPVPPYFDIAFAGSLGIQALNTGSISDFLDIPNIPDVVAGDYTGRTLDLAPHAAVYRCWYDYYRDRNYVPDNEILPLQSGELGDDGDLEEIMKTRYRSWSHDYFNSAMLTTQRGAEVLMPISGTVVPGDMTTGDVRFTGSGTLASGALAGDLGVLEAGGTPAALDIIGEGTIDSSSVSINDLRRAVALQTWLERNQLAGSRYTESIMAHFGRKSSDARLQRAEYLGGGKAVIQVGEIFTTAFSQDDSSGIIPPANMTGKASAYANTNSFRYNCEEHGFIIGMLSVLPTPSYMQGLPRMFRQRRTFLDYPWPTFAHLGEQEVYDSEIYMDTSTVTETGEDPVFGYQSRYADWKFIKSSVHGDFRTTLDFWHLAQKFSALPTLSEEFVTFPDQLQDRIFFVENEDTLLMYVYNDCRVKRSLPYFGTPKLR